MKQFNAIKASSTFLVRALLALSLLSAFPVNAQFSPLQSLTLRDGLPSAAVNQILQTQDGFIWIATTGGLARFDGYSFQIFKHHPRNSQTIVSSNVTSILEAKNGELWIGTENGISIYQRNSGFIHKFEQELPHNYIHDLFQDSENRIWISTDQGLAQWTPNPYDENVSGGILKLFVSQNSGLPDNTVRKTIEDSSGTLWFATEKSLGRYQNGKITAVPIAPHAKPEWLERDEIPAHAKTYDLVEKDGKLWIATTRFGLVCLDLVSQEFEFFTTKTRPDLIRSNNIWTIAADSNKNIWLGYFYQGVTRFNPETVSPLHFKYEANAPYGLPHNEVIDLIEDDSGIVWIATYGGVARYFDGYDGVKYVSGIKDVQLGGTWGMNQEFNKVWLATDNGLFNYDFKLDQLEPVFKRSGLSDPDLLTQNLWDVNPIGNNKYLLGAGLGMVSLDLNTNKVELHKIVDQDNGENLVAFSIEKIRNNKFLLGTDVGSLHVFEPEQGFTKAFKPFDSERHIIEIVHHAERGTWIGTEKGLFYFDQENWEIQSISHPLLDDAHITDIIFCDANFLWVSTLSKGVFQIDVNPQTKNKLISLNHYTPDQGLPDFAISGLIYVEGKVWYASRNLVGFIDTKLEQAFTLYSLFERQGIQFNENSALSKFEDKIIFGGNSGFIIIDPNKVSVRQHQPKVILSSVNKNGYSFRTNLDSGKPMKFDYKDRLLEFNFSVLDYSNPSTNKYAYRLRPDEPWHIAGSNPKITLISLASGDYQLEVKGSNSDGIWSPNTLKIPLVVAPPWWATTAAWIVYSLLVVFAFAYWFAARGKRWRHLMHQANHDPLTGLPNRLYLSDELENRLTALDGHSKYLALVFVDLDKFKQINDQYGHSIGDELLMHVTSRLKASVREEDFIARLAGDEFVLLLSLQKEKSSQKDKKAGSNTGIQAQQVEQTLDRLYHKFDQPFYLSSHTVEVGVSIGVSFTRNPDADQAMLIRHADKAMYKAKAAGGHGYRLHNEDLS